MNKIALGLAAGVGLFALSLVGGSFYTVDQTERGVLLRNGAITGVAQPGLGFKLPFIDKVATVEVTNKLATWERLEGYSHDQQPAHYRISVNYQVNPGSVADLYAQYGGAEAAVERIINPIVPKESKVVIGHFTAQSAIQNRDVLNSEAFDVVTKPLEGNKFVTVTAVQIEDIKFSDAYEKSIEQRMLAEVKVQEIKQNAEREKEQAKITVTQAQARADAVKAEAQASADAIRLKGDAEAAAIKARAAALAQNENLVALTQAERWNGVLPTSMIPGGAVPMLNLSH